MNLSPPERPTWEARLRQPPQGNRVALWLNDTVIGTVGNELPRSFAGDLAHKAPRGVAISLTECRHEDSPGWQLRGPADAALDTLARALRKAGLTGRWRHEQLAVRDGHGTRIGCIERATVRVLGIKTHAVHLVGWTEQAHLWVQQRALDKADDPGLWDTLVGGMVQDGESSQAALVRETQEEAGLLLHSLRRLQYGGCIEVCCPSSVPTQAGHRVERLDWFSAIVPDHLAPNNRDGEVMAFARLSPRELARWIAQGRFTEDAAAILASALQQGQPMPVRP
ncbi:MAG: NUDIX domain-containing protein [Burkholderiaceae bacterium]|nr:NUDIX domain-containing protein [Burkholderiaceae bacterium]